MLTLHLKRRVKTMFKTLRDFFRFCDQEDRRKLYAVMILGTLKALMATFRLAAVAVVIDGLIKGEVTNKTMLWAMICLAISIILPFIISLKSSMLQTEAGYHSCAVKRMEVAEHLRYLPMGYFNKNSLGSITNLTTNTLEGLADIATRVVVLTTQGILTTAVIAVLVFIFDYRIGIILACGLILYGIFNSLMQLSTRAASPRKVRADENIVTRVLEFVQGIAEVKNYSLVDKTAKKLDAAIHDKQMGDTKFEYAVLPFIMLQNLATKGTGLMMSAMSLVFYFNGTMELLYCIMMMIASFVIYDSLDVMSSFSAVMRNIRIFTAKVKEVMSTPVMDIDGEDIKPSKCDIELSHVSFSYDKRKIIDDVSLVIPEKTTTAFVGPSGGGKTTICHLMARFWDTDEGEVLLGGRNVKEYSFDSLMKNFSFVFQNVYLFEDTVANNIRFGRPNASMEEVIEVAKKAGCHEFVSALPNGYDTIIGEGGASLSGGEKQRISIARAIMKDAPIIILDEATANVDPENEAELTKAIEALTEEKTIIMIAHRLKTVRNADRIYVLNDGHIVQQGKHEELMAQNGIYKTFVEGRKEAASWKIAKES